jgi:hypothetical protein
MSKVGELSLRELRYLSVSAVNLPECSPQRNENGGIAFADGVLKFRTLNLIMII